MSVVINNESNKVYEVIDSTQTHFMLKRLGDNREVRVVTSRFYELYRPFSDDDIKRILRTRLRGGNPVVLNPNNSEDGDGEDGAIIEGGDGVQTDIGIMYEPSDVYNFNRIIVTDDVRLAVRQGVKKIELKEFIYETLNLKSIDPVAGKCILNFYGVPGTGKTMTAKAIANELGKKLLQVNYSSIISKWVGDTAKHINQCFEIATENDAILFFDEADSLCSKRLSFDKQAVATSINQNRNVLMQNIDSFDGIVIMATNLFKNFDPALLRRISQHIEFKLPTESMREDIIKLHIPAEVPLASDVDYKKLAKLTNKLSGGDIFSGVKETVIRAVVRTVDDGHPKEEAVISQTDFMAEFDKIKKAKKSHSGGGGLSKKIGFSGDDDGIDTETSLDTVEEQLDAEESAVETNR